MSLRRRVSRIAGRALRGAPPVHLLHIGKTGGTAVKAALGPRLGAARRGVHLHGHRVRLADVPAGEPFGFVVRDPVARFVSGFNSRLRQGRPRFHSPWTRAERAAFAEFRAPRELALGLVARSAARREAARRAMGCIRHVNTSYWDWFVDEPSLRGRADELFFLGRTETLADDFARLCARLGLGAGVGLPADAVAAHRAPPGQDTRLDAEAEAVLRRWYARDYEFLALCGELGADARG